MHTQQSNRDLKIAENRKFAHILRFFTKPTLNRLFAHWPILFLCQGLPNATGPSPIGDGHFRCFIPQNSNKKSAKISNGPKTETAEPILTGFCTDIDIFSTELQPKSRVDQMTHGPPTGPQNFQISDVFVRILGNRAEHPVHTCRSRLPCEGLLAYQVINVCDNCKWVKSHHVFNIIGNGKMRQKHVKSPQLGHPATNPTHIHTSARPHGSLPTYQVLGLSYQRRPNTTRPNILPVSGQVHTGKKYQEN